MKNAKAAIPEIFLVFMALIVFAGITSCDYARMREQESVRTYEKEMPVMDERTVPVQNGFQALRVADPKKLENPVPENASSVKQGHKAYINFCIPCHGRKLDGLGTVGQSFSPLPTNLTSTKVQSLTDGELYAKIRLGYLRHPELYTTISEYDTWAVIRYTRSLARKR